MWHLSREISESLIFGPGKLPENDAALGKGIRDFQRALKPPPEMDLSHARLPGQDPEK